MSEPWKFGRVILAGGRDIPILMRLDGTGIERYPDAGEVTAAVMALNGAVEEIQRLRAECRGRRFDPNLVDEVRRLRALLAEACETGRDLGHIGLDLCRRSPSISTEDMIQKRHDRIAVIRRELEAAGVKP